MVPPAARATQRHDVLSLDTDEKPCDPSDSAVSRSLALVNGAGHPNIRRRPHGSLRPSGKRWILSLSPTRAAALSGRGCWAETAARRHGPAAWKAWLACLTADAIAAALSVGRSRPSLISWPAAVVA